jgi:hypothetical protein
VPGWYSAPPPLPPKKPSPGCTFQYRYLGMCSINITSKISNAYVLVYLWFKSKLLPRTLRNMLYLNFYHTLGWGGMAQSLNNSCKIDTGKVLAHLWLKWKVLPGPINNLIAWVGFCTWSPQQDVKLHTLILKGVTLLIFLVNFPTAKFFFTFISDVHCSFVVHLKFVCHLTILLYMSFGKIKCSTNWTVKVF